MAEFKLNPSAQEKIMALARKKLHEACDSLVSHIRTVTLSRGRRAQGDVLMEGMPPYAFTGELRNKIENRQKEGDPNTRQVGAWKYLPAVVQEKGANIHPGKLMTIPRSDEAINFMMHHGAKARDFPKKLVMIPSRSRTGVFFLVEAKRGGSKNSARSVIHFILARNVRIPPHPWLVPSLKAHWPEMLKIMGS
jgi:hypothetical protein